MIVVDKVTKYYGSHCAVRDLDFQIAEGECIGFLGLNGAGKSTTLRLLSCLLLPTSGRVLIRGIDAEQRPNEIRKFIGYLPDNPPLYGDMTVREYLGYAARLRAMTGDLTARIAEVVTTCNLASAVDRPIGALSHGFRQRVGIAQAIVHNPALLILDEPIQGLDPVQIVEMRGMIRALRGKHTILLSSHILSEIEQTCDRILMMHEGRIAAEGTDAELAERFGAAKALEVLELEILGAESAARAALEKAGATEIKIGPLTEGVLRVRLSTVGDGRAAMARAVVEAELGLLAMRRLSSGLENVFLNMSQAAGREKAS